MSRVVFDTETTGLELGSRAVEIAAVAIDDGGEVIAEFGELINPDMPVPPDVTAVHGITPGMLVSARPSADVLSDFAAWLGTVKATHLIAHNAPYDVGVVGWCLGRAGLAQPAAEVIDTCAIARDQKATKKNSLAALVEHYRIEVPGSAHRAHRDALACLAYYRCVGQPTGGTPWAPAYRYTGALPAHLTSLPDLVAEGGALEFAYVDAKGNRTDRSIIPYGWAETDAGIAFHGLCQMRGERRTFLAERVVV